MTKKSGFTLIEILVGLTILSMGSLLMGQLLTQSYQGGRNYDLRRVVAELGDRSAKTIRSAASQRLTRNNADNLSVFNDVTNEAKAGGDPDTINTASGNDRYFIALVEDSGLVGENGQVLIRKFTAGSQEGFTRGSQPCTGFPSVHCPIQAKAFLQLDCKTVSMCQYQPLIVRIEIEHAIISNNQVVLPPVLSRSLKGYFNSTNNILVDGKMSYDFGSSSSGMNNCMIFGNRRLKCWGLGANGQNGVGNTSNYGHNIASIGSAIPWVGTETDKWKAVSVGGAPNFAADRSSGFACGVRTNGNVACWGINVDGQIGKDPSAQVTGPVDVYRGGDATQVVTGYNHACLLQSSGKARCWGRNTATLGDGGSGNPADRSFNDSPTIWGSAPIWTDLLNNQGKLGTGNATDQFDPDSATLVDGQNFKKLAAGAAHTCGITTGGRVICWGSGGILAAGLYIHDPGSAKRRLEYKMEDDIIDNETKDTEGSFDGIVDDAWAGQTNVGPIYDRVLHLGYLIDSPPAYHEAHVVTPHDNKLEDDNFTLSLFASGTLSPIFLLGASNFGIIAFKGLQDSAPVPRIINDSFPYLLFNQANSVPPWCGPGCPVQPSWGYAISVTLDNGGILTNKTVFSGVTPYSNRIPAFPADAVPRWNHVAATMAYNAGASTTEIKIFVDGVEKAKTTAAGRIRTSLNALTLGIPAQDDPTVDPEQTYPGIYERFQIWESTLSSDEIALTALGHCAWSGMIAPNRSDGIGTSNSCLNSNSVAPLNLRERIRLDATLKDGEDYVKIGNGSEVTDISVGDFHSCAISEGNLYCWGSNYAGQLGQGDRLPRFVPTQVNLGAGFVPRQVAAGGCSMGGEILPHTCAVSEAGQVKCWGGNQKGQLGRGNTIDYGALQDETPSSMSAISLGSGVLAKRVTVGCGHTCVLTDNFRMKCFGYNEFGQLGQGKAVNIGDGSGEMGNDLPYSSIFDDT